MKILELFAGTGGVSKAFEKEGFETYTVDWDEKFDVSLHCDIETLTLEDILNNFGVPDVVWMAPECTTYSLAAISKHRKKNEINGNLDPVSDYAKKCDEVNIHVLELLEQLREINPNLLFFIENPRACLQKMTWMQPYEDYKYFITYCPYLQSEPLENRYMKPTNIWTNHPNPNFLPACKNGCPNHMRAPRGSKSGIQGMANAKIRSTYPKKLIEHIVSISKEYLNSRK